MTPIVHRIARGSAALLPAGILGVYALRPELAFLPYLALVPWVVLYTDDRRARPGYGWYALGAYLGWVLQHTSTFRFGWYAPFAMGLFFAIPWLPFAPLVGRIHRGWGLPRSLSVPLAWVTVEWLRSRFGLGHVDLYSFGYSQARFPALVQVADLTGGYGVSFLVAAVGGWLGDLWFAARDVGGSPQRALRARRVAAGGAAIAAAAALVWGYGLYRLATVRSTPGPRIAIVQPNTPHTNRNALGVHLYQVLLTERAVPAGASDLIIWPENAIMDDVRRDGVYLDDLGWLGARKGSWTLVGAYGRPGGFPGLSTNAAFLIDPTGQIRGSYDKQVLFPFSEYVPLDDALKRWAPPVGRALRWLVRLGWGFQPSGIAGSEMRIFDLPWEGRDVPFAVLICGENMYPPIPRAAGAAGAAFFLNITSEGSVGGPVQEQLLRIAMLRAIENRIAYVRAGNTGISTVLDARGITQSILRGRGGATIDVEGALIDRVPLTDHPPTVYVRSRGAFVGVVVAITVALWATGCFRRPRVRGATVLASAIALGALASCVSPPRLGVDPAAGRSALEDGLALVREKRYAEAIPRLAAACANLETCREALPALGVAYEAGRRDDDAVVLFGEIADRYPELRARALDVQGIFLDRVLDLPGAERAFLESASLEPTALTLARLGGLRMRARDYAGAIAAFESALSIDPGMVQARYLLGRALRLAGRHEAARAQLERVLARDPGHAGAWTNLAMVLEARGEVEASERALLEGARVDPQNLESRFLLARRAMRAEDFKTAARLIREIRAVEDTLGRGPQRADQGRP